MTTKNTTFELAANRLPCICTHCGKPVAPGIILIRWINGYREGNVHSIPCGIQLGWDGEVTHNPPLVWGPRSTGKYKTFVDQADVYEFLPHPDGPNAYGLLKNRDYLLQKYPAPSVPGTVPLELQARLTIASEMSVPFFPTNNEENRLRGLAFRAAKIYNPSTSEADVRSNDPRVDPSPVAKEPAMAKQFLAPKGAASKAPAPVAAKAVAKAPAKAGKVAAAAAPKAGVAASEEEIAAVVAGTIKPRENVGTKNQESLTATDENGKPKGRPLGLTTGLPIMTWFSYAFIQNEKTAAQCKIAGLGRAPDEKIVAAAKREFPGRTSKLHENPQTIRVGYNKGVLTRGAVPSVQSHRYDDKGAVITGRVRSEPGEPAAKKVVASAPAAKGPARKVVKA